MKKIFGILLSILMLSQNAVFAETDDSRFDDIGNRLGELYELISACEEKGIDTSYERINYETISDFVQFGKDDIEMGDTGRAEYVAEKLEQMYTETETALKGYLDGTKEAKKVVRTDGNITIKGGNLVDGSGNPAFLNGYGHFDRTRSELERFQSFGANFAAMEIGPNDVVFKDKEMIDGWMAGGSADADVQVTDRGRIQGTKALKIVNRSEAAPNTYVMVLQSVTVKPNTDYRFEFWARSVSAGKTVFMLSGWHSERNKITEGTNGWTKYEASYTTEENQYSMEIIIACEDKTTVLFLADMALYEGERNILYNGDFEKSDGLESEHFKALGSKVWDRVGKYLETAEKNNVRVDVLISPHYMGTSLKSVYPEMFAFDSGYGFDMHHPYVREYFELYIKMLCNMLGESSALNSFCLVNEPWFTNQGAGLDEPFREYLMQEYQNDINVLNLAYGNSAYTDFSEIAVPEENTKDGLYRDWIMFKDEYYNDFYKFLADCVKKYSDIPVHLKTVFIWGHSNRCTFGADPELIAEFSDYNGNDCWGFYNGKSGYGMATKHMWYEFLKSVKDIPILNSEDHIVVDKNTTFNENHTQQIVADIWQGAVHGRDATAIWLWERSNNKDSLDYGNIRYMPDAVAAAGKTALDMNKLGGYVTALQAAKPTATVLYSKSTGIFEGSGGETNAYFGALAAGCNPDFITERQLENGKMPAADILLVSNAVQISEKARAAIEKYQKNGGRVIAIGANCLTANEYNRPYEKEFRFETVLNNSMSDVSSYLKDYGDSLKIADGDLVENVDIRTAYYGDEYVMNLCNLSWEDGSKYAQIPGEATDLLTGTVYKNEVELKPLTPVLLCFGNAGKLTIRTEQAANGLQLIIQNSMKKDTEAEISFRIYGISDQIFTDAVSAVKKIPAEGQCQINYSGSFLKDDFAVEWNCKYKDSFDKIMNIQSW